jgi:peptidoglycan/LPS O-acetylase OafA/YrhL
MDSSDRIALPTSPTPTTQTSTAVTTGHRSRAIRTDVEGLRAIAILLVVTFHAGVTGITGGFIGVDVFYVLSGYLITGLLVAEIDKTSRLNLLNFYARRVRRLLPAAALVLFATLLVACIIFAPGELEFAARGARSSALYISNLFFMENAADYFSPRVASNPLLHTWSLSVEEQFYLFWPVIILLGLRGLGTVRRLAALLALLTISSLVACIWLTPDHPILTFYSLPTRAWEFGLGGLAALVPAASRRLPPGVWVGLGWLGMALVIGCALTLTPATQFPGWVAVIPVLGTTLTLMSGAGQPHTGACKLLDLAVMQKLGGLSYSWYLWHWPFLVFAAALVPDIGPVGKAMAIVASLAVAELAHRCVENPIRFNSGLVKRPALSLAGAVAIGLVCVTAASLTVRFGEAIGRRPDMVASTNAVHDISSITRVHCVADDGTVEAKTCTFGDTHSATTLALFGDSHAIPWFEPLHQLVNSRGWNLTTVLKAGCSAGDYPSQLRDPVENAACAKWRAAALAEVIRMHPSLVILGNASNRLYRVSDPARHASAEDLQLRRDGTRRVVEKLFHAGLRVMLMRDNPEFAFDMPTCLGRSERHSWYAGKGCEMPIAAVLDPKVFEAEQEAVAGIPDVFVVDLTGELCHNGVCGGTDNGMVIYRDTDHLAGHFAASLEPLLEPKVLAALAAR